MTSQPPPGGPSWQHEPATSQAAGSSASSSFFRWLRGLDLARASDRWLGGVAGALSRRTGLDLALVRGLIVVLAVFGGIGVLLYGLAWALLPEPDGRIHVEEAGRGSWTTGLTGAAVLVALGLWRPDLPFLGDGGTGGLLWALFWIGAVVLFIYWIINQSKAGAIAPEGVTAPPGGGTAPGTDGPPASSSTVKSAVDSTVRSTENTENTETRATPESAPPTLPYTPAKATWSPGPPEPYGFFSGPSAPMLPVPAPKTLRTCPPRPSGAATALLIGGAILVAGTLLALDHLRILDLADPAVVALASAAVVLALGIMVLGARGRTSGMVGFIAALTTSAALVTSFTGVGGTFVVAQHTSNTPTSFTAVERGYNVMAAQTTVDLTSLPRPRADVVIPVNALVSDVTVIVPDDLPVEVRTRMALGSTDALGASTDVDEPAPAGDDGGILQLTTTDLNPGALGSGFVLDVDGALSDVSIITAPAVRGPSSYSPSTGDLP